MERIHYEKEIFGMLFKTSNSLQVYLDTLLKKDQLTAKQMFLMIVINTFGESFPTLKEVADKSSSSYQNVKQLALKLERGGYVEILQDAEDKRKKRLRLTDKAQAYWKDRNESDQQEMDKLFSGCETSDLAQFLKVMYQLQENIEKM